MTTNEMLSRLMNDKVRIRIINGEYHWQSDFMCELCKNDDDIYLRAKGERHTSFDAAIISAYNKFYNIVEHGLPEFVGQVITHRPSKPEFE